MLSGERSSGEIQEGLSGLLGLSLSWHGLYNPYPMKKYSIGINIACGCSSVTIDPQAWTSTKALYLRSNFVIMWRASEWKGELSPTNTRVRHLSFFNPLVMSGLSSTCLSYVRLRNFCTTANILAEVPLKQKLLK